MRKFSRSRAGTAGSGSPRRFLPFLRTVHAVALVFASVLAPDASAQPGEASPPDVKTKLVVPAKLAPGAKSAVAVEVTLGPKWHVNSHVPSEEFLIPTDVTLAAVPGSVSAVRYPKDVERRLAFSAKPLKVYEGTVRFAADLKVPAKATGKVSLTGTLSYQVCNDRQCFAPVQVPLAATIAIRSAAR